MDYEDFDVRSKNFKSRIAKSTTGKHGKGIVQKNRRRKWGMKILVNWIDKNSWKKHGIVRFSNKFNMCILQERKTKKKISWSTIFKTFSFRWSHAHRQKKEIQSQNWLRGKRFCFSQHTGKKWRRNNFYVEHILSLQKVIIYW